MKTHELKILDRFYKQIENGEKTFEIRYNDRGFQRGDFMKLKEINSAIQYTGNETLLEITNVFQEKGFGLEEGYCILSFKKIGL